MNRRGDHHPGPGHHHGRHDHHGHRHHSTKDVQVTYYDRQREDDFEIERPRGAGRLYEYLLRFKFRRALELLGEPVSGRTVLCVCAGAGMDVEFLVEQGAEVVGLDFSLGTILGARERARRHQFSAGLVVGDAERLPVKDNSFDYCYVHDGLHHLDAPKKALAELARVARRAVIITEPADAALTALAIRLGVIDAYEEAGNYVIRFDADQLATFFESAGFRDARASRYLMKYPHVPNTLFRALSQPGSFLLAKTVFLIFGDRLLARFGNKICFVARRAP